MMPGLIALFGGYVLLSAWQARRALRAGADTRGAEAVRFLFVSALGLPIAIAMILAA